MKIYIAALLSVFVIMVQGSAAAADERSHAALIGELLDKSGFEKQLAEIGPAVDRGFDKGAATLDESQRTELRDAYKAAFAVDVLTADARLTAAKFISPAVAKGALAWLDSPLGERINDMENAFSVAEGFEERMQAGAALLKTLPSARLERYKRLATAIKIAEAYTTIFIDTTLAATRGIDSIKKTLSEEKLAELKARLTAVTPQLNERFLEQALAIISGTYQTLEDKNLDRYIAYSETATGRSCNAGLIKVMDIVVSNASLEGGRRIADVKSKADGT